MTAAPRPSGYERNRAHAMAAAEFDGRRRVFVGDAAEVVAALFREGGASAGDVDPAIALPRVIERLRGVLLVPIGETPDADGVMRYRVIGDARLVEYRPPAGGQG